MPCHDERVNEIALVIAPYEFGIGNCPGLEPVIDGLSLVDILKHADGEISNAGLTDIDEALTRFRAVRPDETPLTVQVLGCLCGVDDCSYVTATISATDEVVTWSDLRTTRRPNGPPGSATYGEIGTFTFARGQYAAAVAEPIRMEEPVRERADVEALAAGVPRDHAEWLRAMTMAFGRDFITLDAPPAVSTVVVRGLRAFADAGSPMPEEAVRRWLRGRRFTDAAVEQYVAAFRELSARNP